jgi:hypothetical protein
VAREEAREEGVAADGRASGGVGEPAEEGRDAGAEGCGAPGDELSTGAAASGEALDPTGVNVHVEAAASQVRAALCFARARCGPPCRRAYALGLPDTFTRCCRTSKA